VIPEKDRKRRLDKTMVVVNHDVRFGLLDPRHDFPKETIPRFKRSADDPEIRIEALSSGSIGPKVRGKNTDMMPAVSSAMPMFRTYEEKPPTLG